MNNEEIQALMSQLKDAGLTPEDIADGILWPLFRDGKMSKEDLSALCASIGLELDENFENDTHADPIDEKGGAEGGEGSPAPGITKEEAEEAKEIKPGETAEEFKDKIEESAGAPAEGQEGSEGGEGDQGQEADEEAEWAEAKKLFKL